MVNGTQGRQVLEEHGQAATQLNIEGVTWLIQHMLRRLFK